MNLNGNYLQLILVLQCTHMLLQVTEEPDRIEVSQCPSEIEVVEGTSINMECFYEEERHMEGIRVDWSKDSKWIVNTTNSDVIVNPVFDNRLFCTINKTKAKLTIKNIAQEDAGLYICKIYIEIPPPVQRGSGNGTKLIVRGKVLTQASVDRSWYLLAALKISFFGIIVLMMFVVTRLCVLRFQNQPAEDK
ncbi:cytotoxic T-lymphocyte protein 4-like isoform X2 [Carcharodon carcharias]|uniref:cytotoxic T-lymphocyte protein 4-like isoform X2 n=1 Tax=Carcharodon carcharias TaxID=13397 RepID=UPI001B7D9B2F|nr:cytotoxic T-lymphocyte protein 4-like isoform X2 [Carcharodon carcharias]